MSPLRPATSCWTSESRTDVTPGASHPFGVSDYAVTYVGYQLFANLLIASVALSPQIHEDSCASSTNPGAVERGLGLVPCQPGQAVPEAPLAPALLVAPAAAAIIVGLTMRR